MGRVNFGTVSASYQVSDALRLAASLGAIGGKVGDDTGETATARAYSLEASYRVSGPVKVYANVNCYNTGDADWGNGRTIGLGLKVNFGGKSMANGKVADLDALSNMRWGGDW